jgi:hypothetical protein
VERSVTEATRPVLFPRLIALFYFPALLPCFISPPYCPALFPRLIALLYFPALLPCFISLLYFPALFPRFIAPMYRHCIFSHRFTKYLQPLVYNFIIIDCLFLCILLFIKIILQYRINKVLLILHANIMIDDLKVTTLQSKNYHDYLMANII